MDTGPQWTAPARRYVPSHLKPGTSRSSFAKPFEPTGGVTAVPAQPTVFGSKGHHSATAKANLSSANGSFARDGAPVDDELPPTQSIKINRGGAGSLRMDTHASVNPRPTDAGVAMSTPPSTPHRQRNNGDNFSQGHSVVVFGFPPGTTQAVIQHFAKFGEIVANVPHTGSSPGSSANTSVAGNTTRRPASIECGRNWLRIAYTDRAGAQRALAENGRVMPGQFVIGCVPMDSAESGLLQSSETNSLLADDTDASILPDLSFDETSSVPQQAADGEVKQRTPRKILVRPPASSLFRTGRPVTAQRPATVSVPEPVREQPKSWLGWASQKARETVFGWDDL